MWYYDILNSKLYELIRIGYGFTVDIMSISKLPKFFWAGSNPCGFKVSQWSVCCIKSYGSILEDIKAKALSYEPLFKRLCYFVLVYEFPYALEWFLNANTSLFLCKIEPLFEWKCPVCMG